MGKIEIEIELKKLNKRLCKAKSAAKDLGIDHMRYQPYIDIFNIVKAKKKELNQMDLARFKNAGTQMLKNNNNGRTQYVKTL